MNLGITMMRIREKQTACDKERREADPNAPDQICNSILMRNARMMINARQVSK